MDISSGGAPTIQTVSKQKILTVISPQDITDILWQARAEDENVKVSEFVNRISCLETINFNQGIMMPSAASSVRKWDYVKLLRNDRQRLTGRGDRFGMVADVRRYLKSHIAHVDMR